MKKRLTCVSLCLFLAGTLLLNGCTPRESGRFPSDRETDGISSSAAEERYTDIDENEKTLSEDGDTVTFSLKVDTAAYTNIQRYLENGELPPQNAVRTEEMINYFNYESIPDFTEGPFSVSAEIGPSPFSENKKLAFIRVKTENIDRENLPDSNLTFLIDTSGSMDSYDKLPLLKSAFTLLVETLDEKDRVSIVTYAGSSEVVLDSAR